MTLPLDRDAEFRRLYDELYPAVWAHCRRLLGVPGDADDATQEVFLAVHRGLDGFRGDSQLFTWVYRIATRVALRHRARLRRAAAIPEPEPAPAHGAHALPHQIERALTKLSVEHATVLSLFAMEGLTHREIADILGVPEGTVWSRLHAARKKLAAELDWP